MHRDSYVEVDKAFYTVPPEYISDWVWVRWDSREVRIYNQRWEQLVLHAHLPPGQFDKVLGLGGGHGPLERQLDYWLKRAQELGAPCGAWAQAMLHHKGPLGLRSIMGLLPPREGRIRFAGRAFSRAERETVHHGPRELRHVHAADDVGLYHPGGRSTARPRRARTGPPGAASPPRFPEMFSFPARPRPAP